MENSKNGLPDSEQEFNRVYNEHSTVILNTAYKYLKDVHMAQDVTQEVLLCYFLHQDTTDASYERRWLVRVTVNLCINILKKRKHEVVSESIELISDYNDTHETEKLNVEYQFIETQRQKVISDICEKMLSDLEKEKEQCYHAMHEVYWNERPGVQVAKEMDMTKGSFYTMVCRVKGKIRKKYVKRYAEVKEM